jgi:ABC-type sugar transport system permease subunit
MSYPVMTVAVGIIWQWLYNEKVGLINYILISLGVIGRGIPFLQSFELALPSVIVASIWQVIGFYMIILLAGLQTIPSELYESAAIDGASQWMQFRRITLPLLRPSVFLCFVIGIINSFTNFDLIFVMTQGGPAHATDLLITYIYSTAFKLSKFDYAAALTVVNFLFFLALALLANKASGGEAGAVEIGK